MHGAITEGIQKRVSDRQCNRYRFLNSQCYDLWDDSIVIIDDDIR